MTVDNEQISTWKKSKYRLARRADIHFIEEGNNIDRTFEIKGMISDKQQRTGWQAILVNFKNYVESRV